MSGDERTLEEADAAVMLQELAHITYHVEQLRRVVAGSGLAGVPVVDALLSDIDRAVSSLRHPLEP